MDSPLVQIDELGDLIRQLHKLDSKMQAGQFIAAYRENRRLISELEAKKVELIKQAENATELNRSTEHGAISRESSNE